MLKLDWFHYLLGAWFVSLILQFSILPAEFHLFVAKLHLIWVFVIIFLSIICRENNEPET